MEEEEKLKQIVIKGMGIFFFYFHWNSLWNLPELSCRKETLYQS